MAFTAAGDTAPQTVYLLRQFMSQLTKKLQFSKLATQGDVPEQGGRQVKWMHIDEIAVDVSTLSETDATDNELASLTITNTTETLKSFGQWLKISEEQRRTMMAGTMDQIAERFAELGWRTIDTLLYTEAKTTTNYFKAAETAVNTGTLAAGDTLKASDFSYLSAYFHGIGANGFEGGNNLADFGGNYAAVISPTQLAQLQSQEKGTTGVPTWHDLNQRHGQGENVMKGEAGSLYGIQILQSPIVTAVAEVDTGISGYAGIATSRDGLGWAGIDAREPEILVKTPGPNSTDQPLDTYSTIGFKVFGREAMLQASRVVVLYSYAA